MSSGEFDTAQWIALHEGRFERTLAAARPHLPTSGSVGVVGGSPFDGRLQQRFPAWVLRNVYLRPRGSNGGAVAGLAGAEAGVSVPVGGPLGPLEATFDVVWFTEVLEHLLEDDGEVLRTIASLLRPGGILVFSVPNAAGFGNRVKLALGRNVHWEKDRILHGTFGGFGHIREYTFAEVRRLLGPEFETLVLVGAGGYRKGASRVLDLLPRTFANTIVAIARRPAGGPPRRTVA